MSTRTLSVDDRLHQYLVERTLREPELLARLREETSRSPSAQMQISPEQGQFMRLLAQLVGARQCLEIGVFTGYSSLSVALGLPPEGRLVALDVSEEWTAVARRYWQEAGVAEKIELRLAPALSSIEALLGEGRAGTFDFVFIDADKLNYDAYYEGALKLLRPAGLVAIDNILWSGRVADPAENSEETRVMRALTAKVREDSRVSMSLVPIGDGLLLAQKVG
jgi:predicted O-methyltransferase YrrM